MRRRNRREHKDRTDRWIFSYADFITLLFAFFVVMYAVSSVNLGKYKQLSDSLEGAFKTKMQLATINTEREKMFINQNANKIHEQVTSQQGKFLQTTNLLKKLEDDYDDLRSYEDWTEIELSSKSLFYSGSADPTEEALEKLKRLAEKLKGTPSRISIEGYTDNKPIFTAKYPSNWELSAARAAAVARILTDSGINPNKISVVGYGEQYPVADNDTKEGRQKNRRVVLVVARDSMVQRLLNPPIIKQPKKETKPVEPVEDTTNKIPIVKEIRTETGGLKFTREFVEEKKQANKSTSGQNDNQKKQ